MFREKTVLIVGAGASAELGLPLGGALAGLIQQAAGKELDHALHQNFATRYPNKLRLYADAARHLARSLPAYQTIDEALHFFNGSRETIEFGKAAIARFILSSERNSALYKLRNKIGDSVRLVSRAWLYPFFQMAVGGLMKEEISEQAFKNVTIINFNYDRTIEQYLTFALQHYSHMTEDQAIATVESLTFIRPYGSLGRLTEEGIKIRSFGGNDDDFSNDFIEIATRIRTFTEQITDATLDGRINKATAQAKAIIALGFGYHPQNLQLLKCDMPSEAVLFGSVYKFPHENIDDLSEALSNNFGLSDSPRLYNKSATDLLSDLRLAITARVG